MSFELLYIFNSVSRSSWTTSFKTRSKKFQSDDPLQSQRPHKLKSLHVLSEMDLGRPQTHCIIRTLAASNQNWGEFTRFRVGTCFSARWHTHQPPTCFSSKLKKFRFHGPLTRNVQVSTYRAAKVIVTADLKSVGAQNDVSKLCSQNQT